MDEKEEKSDQEQELARLEAVNAELRAEIGRLRVKQRLLQTIDLPEEISIARPKKESKPIFISTGKGKRAKIQTHDLPEEDSEQKKAAILKRLGKGEKK